MIGVMNSWLAQIARWWRRKSSIIPEARRRRRFVPRLESLEDRAVPATLYFRGVLGALWSAPNTWVNAQGRNLAPAAGDTLIFQPSLGRIGGVALTNNPSTDDITVPLNQVTVDGSYTQSITLAQDLTIRANFQYSPGGGSLLSAGGGRHQLRVDPLGGNATCYWAGAATTANVDIRVCLEISPSDIPMR